MNKQKPVALNGISFYHKNGNHIVTEGMNLTFFNYEKMEKYISERKRYWSELLGEELVMSPDSNETLMMADVLRVLKLVCVKSDTPFVKANSKYRGGREVEARRFTIAICARRNMQITTIAKGIGQDHSNVTHHIKTHDNLCFTDTSYNQRFLEIDDYVLSKLNGRYNTDGSGEKLKT